MITVDQVTAYLLRRDGWREDSRASGCRTFFYYRAAAIPVVVAEGGFIADERMLSCILDIARAESRPALDVAEDIAGPVVGVGGVGCGYVLTFAEWWASAHCRPLSVCNRVAPRAPEVE